MESILRNLVSVAQTVVEGKGVCGNAAQRFCHPYKLLPQTKKEENQ